MQAGGRHAVPPPAPQQPQVPVVGAPSARPPGKTHEHSRLKLLPPLQLALDTPPESRPQFPQVHPGSCFSCPWHPLLSPECFSASRLGDSPPTRPLLNDSIYRPQAWAREETYTF